MNTILRLISTAFMALLISTPLNAQDVWISPDLPFLDFEVGDDFYLIERGNDNSEFVAEAYPPRATRPCPPFCIQPIVLSKGVTTVGEVELVDFIMDFVIPEDGLLVDARVETWYKSGTIPGSVNIPFNMFTSFDSNPFLGQIMLLLGGVQNGGTWDYSSAKSLLMYCNGPDCGQSPRAINNMLALGYPPEKLYYYRGGMKTWANFGFSIIIPE